MLIASTIAACFCGVFAGLIIHRSTEKLRLAGPQLSAWLGWIFAGLTIFFAIYLIYSGLTPHPSRYEDIPPISFAFLGLFILGLLIVFAVIGWVWSRRMTVKWQLAFGFVMAEICALVMLVAGLYYCDDGIVNMLVGNSKDIPTFLSSYERAQNLVGYYYWATVVTVLILLAFAGKSWSKLKPISD